MQSETVDVTDRQDLPNPFYLLAFIIKEQTNLESLAWEKT